MYNYVAGKGWRFYRLRFYPHNYHTTTTHKQPRRRFYSLYIANMKTTTAQFKNCHATVTTFTVEGTPKGWNFVIFYSYACPKLVIFPDGATYRFSFENSRKAGEKTGSTSTSRQCNAWLWYDHRTLNEYKLEAFERKFFDTRLEKYY